MNSDNVMTDKHGRRMRKLRISLLDACNMRCMYCMPEEPVFMPKSEWASAEDIIRIAGNLITMGIEEVRLTGGEPTLRPDMMEIVEGISELPLRKLGLTTNGLLLGKFLPALTATDCQYINISLDSLSPENFFRITKRDVGREVINTILRARDMGFQVKVNMVVMRGLNEHELIDFVEWSGREHVPVRFLEAMNIGVQQSQFKTRLLTAKAMQEIIREQFILTRKLDAKDATAYTFLASNGGDIGFIASESEPFCGGCSRLRLTPQGHIRPCLFKETGIDLKPLAFEEYPEALAAVIAMKPTGRIAHVSQPMHQIGG